MWPWAELIKVLRGRVHVASDPEVPWQRRLLAGKQAISRLVASLGSEVGSGNKCKMVVDTGTSVLTGPSKVGTDPGKDRKCLVRLQQFEQASKYYLHV